MVRRWRWAIAVWVLLTAIGLAPAQPAAAATPFRRVAPSIKSFASDGERYVAWQVMSTSPITVLDTRTGARREIAASGCELRNEDFQPRGGPAAAGRFLVDCHVASGLLDVRSASVTMLPTGLYGPAWDVVGRYSIEGGDAKSACRQSAAERHMRVQCLALYDIATGAVSVRPQFQAANLDRPGAPLICPALRARVIADTATDSGEYSDNRFSEPGDPLRIYHCHGPPTVIRHPGSTSDVSLRGTLLSWDDGLDVLPATEEEKPSLKGLTHGTLSTFTLANGHRRSFTLPALPVPIGQQHSLTGVFGYSAHTSYAVIWIATRTLAFGEAGATVATYSVYTAKL